MLIDAKNILFLDVREHRFMLALVGDRPVLEVTHGFLEVLTDIADSK